MDPDVVLKELREAVQRWHQANAVDFYLHPERLGDNLFQAGTDMAQHFEDLDEWLRQGNFIPRDWRGHGD